MIRLIIERIITTVFLTISLTAGILCFIEFYDDGRKLWLALGVVNILCLCNNIISLAESKD